MALNFPLIGAMAPTVSQLPPAAKRDWRASLFDRLMPDDGLEDPDKEAAMRQGLLGLASGLLGTGGGFGNALSAGIQSGLLATNQSVDSQQDRKYKQQMIDMRLSGGGKPAQQQYAEWLLNQVPEDQRDQTLGVLAGYAPRPSSAAIQYKTIKGADGREYQVAMDPREVGAQTIGGGPSFGSFATPDPISGDPFAFLGDMGITPTSGLRTPERNAKVGGVPNSYHLTGQARDILPPKTPQEAAAIRQNAAMNGLEVIDEGDHWHLEPSGQQRRNPFASRTPEEQAALTTTAEQRAELAVLPARNRLEAEGAGMTTAAQEAARTAAEFAAYDQMVANEENKARRLGAVKNEVEQSAKQTDKDSALRLYEAGMTGVTDGLARANTGPLIGRLPAVTTDQQIAQGGVAAIAPVLKQLFRTAGEGTFTDKDQELLMQMIPTRIDTPESIEWKLQNIDRIVKAKLNAAPDAGALESLTDEDLLRQLGGM